METAREAVLDSLCRALTVEMSQYGNVEVKPMAGILGYMPAATQNYIAVYINGEQTTALRVKNANPTKTEYEGICSAIYMNIQDWLKYYAPKPKKGKRINIGQL